MPLAPAAPWSALFPWAETAIVAFAFVWGAMLGSFLNVVAHRVPRGASVVRGRSRCPACGAAIRPRDNVPVFGWLLLRGRCRDCRAPIAARYPLVEAGCGLLVAAIAAVDLVAGGIDRVLLHGDWLPLARCGLHAACGLTLVAWGLLASGGSGPARRTVLVAVACVGLAVTALPALQPIGILPGGAAWPAGRPRLATLAAWLAGSSIGVAAEVGLGLRWGWLPLVGATFGWQVVTVLTILSAMVRALGRRSGGAGREMAGNGDVPRV